MEAEIIDMQELMEQTITVHILVEDNNHLKDSI